MATVQCKRLPQAFCVMLDKRNSASKHEAWSETNREITHAKYVSVSTARAAGCLPTMQRSKNATTAAMFLTKQMFYCSHRVIKTGLSVELVRFYITAPYMSANYGNYKSEIDGERNNYTRHVYMYYLHFLDPSISRSDRRPAPVVSISRQSRHTVSCPYKRRAEPVLSSSSAVMT